MTETLPADQNALRRRSYNTYTAFNTGSGVIYRVTRSETCGLSPSQLALTACPALNTTSVVITNYGDSSLAPNTYKTFLPYTVTQTDGAGSVSATTTYSYDSAGRVTALDGPLAGAVDVAYTTYDAAGRAIFEIDVDPDGSGSLKRKIIKHTYDNDDREIRKDVGAGTTTNGSDFAVLSFTRNTYDPTTGLLVKTEQVQP